MTLVAQALLAIAVVGLLSSTVFLALALIAAIRYRRKRPLYAEPARWPGVSLIKPLHGMEPQLRENLASFFGQDYAEYEIVCAARRADDPALTVVRELSEQYPQVPLRIVLAGEPGKPNAKVQSLEKMIAEARYEYLIISDSDVRADPSYIREVVRPLLEPGIGLVSCLYRGVPRGGLWSRLEALGMSVEMTSGVIIADMLEGMKFALGPTMATRKSVISEVGGAGVLADYCADDYVLGKLVAAAGHRVLLSHHVIDHVVVNRAMKPSLLHQVRWMKSTRFSRPKGHLGTGLTFATPFGLLAVLAAAMLGRLEVGAALLGWALCNRIVQSACIGGGVVRDRNAVVFCWLYPLRDLMGFFFWVASYFGDTVVWRGERYRMRAGGFMEPVKPREGERETTRVG